MSAGAIGLKICGVTHLDDIEACGEAGVTAVGLNLWPRSKRALGIEQARPLAARARTRGMTVVAVMVDPSEAQVREAFERLAIDLWQPHGDAPVERSAAMGHPYVWVIRGTPSLSSLRPPRPAPAWILLDASVPGYGGEGVATDWSWAAAAVAQLSAFPVWLAGGITPDNGMEARHRVAPAGLDVASGAERDGGPRRKDAAKIAALASICQNRPAS